MNKMQAIAMRRIDEYIDSLEAERDRYRKALERIIEHNSVISLSAFFGTPLEMTTTVIAKQALETKDD